MHAISNCVLFCSAVFLVSVLSTHQRDAMGAAAPGDDKTPAHVFAQGDEAACKEALTQIAAEREKTIAELVNIVKTGGSGERALTATTYALLAVGKLKAVEALDLIISKLGYKVTQEGWRVNLGPPPDEKYPAIAALIDIGPCVVDSVLRAIADGKVEEEQTVRNAGYVLVRVLGKEAGKKKILAYASSVGDRDKQARILSKDILCYYE